jgi:endonuclease YncB( thermonuclease family)
VNDGDTIQIKDRVVRLRGIDAPETDQPFGTDAALHLKSLVYGRHVRVEYSETDQYGRIVGTVYCQMEDINLAMIRDGFAWHYKQYDNTQSYADAEDEARISRRGLWIDDTPIPPCEYRSMKRQ